jgi:hypothetical protein
MPTLPRTPTTSAGGLCVIGGADESAQIQSLTERVAKLEQALAYVLGQDISASQLSDISQNAGWITGVTYMGQPGWTRTPSGTLIPPAGFSLSGSGLFNMYDYCTGETVPYQGVSVDENGVIQFGFKPNGEVCGEKVDQWDGGGAPDFYRYAISFSGSYDQNSGRGITFGSNGYSCGAGVYSGSAEFTISQAGLYLAQHSATWIFSGGTAANTILATQAYLRAGTNGIPTKWQTERNDIQWVKTLVGQTFQDQTGDLLHMNQSEVFMLDLTNNKIQTHMSAYALPGANLPGDIHFLKVNLSVVRLGSAT